METAKARTVQFFETVHKQPYMVVKKLNLIVKEAEESHIPEGEILLMTRGCQKKFFASASNIFDIIEEEILHASKKGSTSKPHDFFLDYMISIEKSDSKSIITLFGILRSPFTKLSQSFKNELSYYTRILLDSEKFIVDSNKALSLVKDPIIDLDEENHKVVFDCYLTTLDRGYDIPFPAELQKIVDYYEYKPHIWG